MMQPEDAATNETRTIMNKRTIEVFTGDCPTCEDKVAEIKAAACPACEVIVLPIADNAERAQSLGVARTPAVAVNGKLAACCETGSVDMSLLKGLGLGTAAA